MLFLSNTHTLHTHTHLFITDWINHSTILTLYSLHDLTILDNLFSRGIAVKFPNVIQVRIDKSKDSA